MRDDREKRDSFGHRSPRSTHRFVLVPVAVGVERQRGLRIIHGQDQSGASDHQLMVAECQLSIQSLVRVHGHSSDGRTARVGTCSVCAHGDVTVRQIDVTVIQDQVGVVVFQLPLILKENTFVDENRKTLF